MQNRAFLNQITTVDCSGPCGAPAFWDLEPLPPGNPAPGTALATPFAIKVSPDDATLVATAASSNRLFTVDTASGAVLGQVDVDATPRGLALEASAQGAPSRAWVLNVSSNTVSVVDLADLAAPSVSNTIPLDDPTHPDVKLGRIAFNDAEASTTETFSCESCHPDGGTDQLIWVLDTPICDVPGCTQIAPRLTMPIRGLRDTQPYHWDGIPGDPHGGNNTASINADVAPNCSVDDEESCTRHLLDGSLATTMCDQAACPTNDEGLAGALDAVDRDALAKFLLAVPFPPAQARPADNTLTPSARAGYFEFNLEAECGNCHKMPFWVSTNTPGTGMDAPTWRGAFDRWMITPQARINIIDLMNLVNMDDSFPERDMWILAGATPDIWQMVLEGSTGFPGAFARQLTLDSQSAADPVTEAMLDALETSATEGAILLQAEGVQIANNTGTAIALGFVNGAYITRDTANPDSYSRTELLDMATNGTLVLTLIGRLGLNVDIDNPQPALWQDVPIHQQTGAVHMPFQAGDRSLRYKGRHIQPDARIFLNGRRVEGQVRCEGGTLPNCNDEIVIIEPATIPAEGGVHFVQVQNRYGLMSNDALHYTDQNTVPARPGNLINSDGRFNSWDDNWNTVLIAGSVAHTNGTLNFTVDSAAPQPWHVQLSHPVWLEAGHQYTLCYDARAASARSMTAYFDAGAPNYENVSGGQRTVNLTTSFQQFSHTVTIQATDLTARVAWDMAQSAINVTFDNVGLYEGSSCGTP